MMQTSPHHTCTWKINIIHILVQDQQFQTDHHHDTYTDFKNTKRRNYSGRLPTKKLQATEWGVVAYMYNIIKKIENEWKQCVSLMISVSKVKTYKKYSRNKSGKKQVEDQDLNTRFSGLLLHCFDARWRPS